MKSYLFAALFFATMLVSSCHYGQNEANGTLETNDQYKADKADYSVNRAGEGGKLNDEAKVEAAPADTATVVAPAPAAEPKAEGTH
ncbi:MAG: hypothetical protein WC760_00090 [Bacteroidia bacterium]|jgi:hypothetical protein